MKNLTTLFKLDATVVTIDMKDDVYKHVSSSIKAKNKAIIQQNS